MLFFKIVEEVIALLNPKLKKAIFNGFLNIKGASLDKQKNLKLKELLWQKLVAFCGQIQSPRGLDLRIPEKTFFFWLPVALQRSRPFPKGITTEEKISNFIKKRLGLFQSSAKGCFQRIGLQPLIHKSKRGKAWFGLKSGKQLALKFYLERDFSMFLSQICRGE